MSMRVVLRCAVALTIVACGGGGSNNYSSPTGTTGTSGTTSTNQVPANTIQATDGLVFNPTTLTVAKGTTVTFTFGSIAHTVNFNSAGAPANIPESSSATVQRTFSTAGTYGFTCSIHGGYMVGQVTVQ